MSNVLDLLNLSRKIQFLKRNQAPTSCHMQMLWKRHHVRTWTFESRPISIFVMVYLLVVVLRVSHYLEKRICLEYTSIVTAYAYCLLRLIQQFVRSSHSVQNVYFKCRVFLASKWPNLLNTTKNVRVSKWLKNAHAKNL